MRLISRNAKDGGRWGANQLLEDMKASVVHTLAFVMGRLRFGAPSIFLEKLSPVANVESQNTVRLCLRHKVVPGLCAEVRHIDNCSRVVCNHPQNLSLRHARQAFARLEHGQGAQQPERVEGLIWVTHTR